MTKEGAGMTKEGAGMTKEAAGTTKEAAGTTNGSNIVIVSEAWRSNSSCFFFLDCFVVTLLATT
jgi:hypothetical protein